MSTDTRKPGTEPLPITVRTMIALASEIHKTSHIDLNDAVLNLERSYGCASVVVVKGGIVLLTFDPDSLESFDLVTAPGDECPDYFDPQSDWFLAVEPGV